MRASIVCKIFLLSLLTSSCGISAHYVISTDAMKPTIEIGDHFTTFNLNSDIFNPIERFDIVVFKPPVDKENGIDENTKFVFRVIALCGEKIEIKKRSCLYKRSTS